MRIWNFPPKDPALARVVGPPWLAWEGIFGALGLIAYLGAYRRQE